MPSDEMYTHRSPRDHIDRLGEILHLCKVGAAACETSLGISHMPEAQTTMFETIHRLASEAMEIADNLPANDQRPPK